MMKDNQASVDSLLRICLFGSDANIVESVKESGELPGSLTLMITKRGDYLSRNADTETLLSAC
jgi:hypothetical protein